MSKVKSITGIELNGTVVRNNPKENSFSVSIKKKDGTFKCIDSVLSEEMKKDGVSIGDYVTIKCKINSGRGIIVKILKTVKK